MEANMTCLFSLMKFYFDLGLRHWEIVLSLSHIDGITIIIYLSPSLPFLSLISYIGQKTKSHQKAQKLGICAEQESP